MASTRISEADAPVVKQSLVVRTGYALAGVILATMVGIVAAALTAESVDGDAATINLAGSLRMQSYRIAVSILTNEAGAEIIAHEVNDFSERLKSPRSRSILTRNTRLELNQS